MNKIIFLFKKIDNDDVFSTETGLELVGIARPVRLLWMSDSSAKIRNKRIDRDRPLPL